MNHKKYDLIIVGANGFVGSRFIKYYSKYFLQNKIKVLATGRNEKKLRTLLKAHNHIDSAVMDNQDQKMVFSLIAQGSLVLNFAGPFDLYGENIVHACAKFGVHYLDITGEVNFSRRMMDQYESLAESTGAKIVSFSGFDSIPSDYAVYLLEKKVRQSGQKLKHIHLVYKMKGGFNGGTLLTSLDMAKKMNSDDFRNANYLSPSKAKLYLKNQNQLRYIPEQKCWANPFFMEHINSKIVHRSMYLRDKNAWARDHTYNESMLVSRSKWKNLLFNKLSLWQQSLSQYKWVGHLLEKYVYRSGQGPTEEQIAQGYFKLYAYAEGDKGYHAYLNMSSTGDPGNLSTIKLIGAAMKNILTKQSPSKGFLTPSLAFGDSLLPHLEAEGIRIS